MKLYIGNPTKQTHIFHFRLPGHNAHQLFQRTLVPGQQVCIDDLEGGDAQAIIDQHRAFGFCTVKEAMRKRSYHGLVYSEGTPISAARLVDGIYYDHEQLTEEGEQTRKVAESTISDSVESIADKRNRKRTENVSVEISAEDEGAVAESAPAVEPSKSGK